MFEPLFHTGMTVLDQAFSRMENSLIEPATNREFPKSGATNDEFLKWATTNPESHFRNS